MKIDSKDTHRETEKTTRKEDEVTVSEIYSGGVGRRTTRLKGGCMSKDL